MVYSRTERIPYKLESQKTKKKQKNRGSPRPTTFVEGNNWGRNYRCARLTDSVEVVASEDVELLIGGAHINNERRTIRPAIKLDAFSGIKSFSLKTYPVRVLRFMPGSCSKDQFQMNIGFHQSLELFNLYPFVGGWLVVVAHVNPVAKAPVHLWEIDKWTANSHTIE